MVRLDLRCGNGCRSESAIWTASRCGWTTMRQVSESDQRAPAPCNGGPWRTLLELSWAEGSGLPLIHDEAVDEWGTKDFWLLHDWATCHSPKLMTGPPGRSTRFILLRG